MGLHTIHTVAYHWEGVWRSWAEDEAKRAREQAKVLEEARDRWESQGIKVVVNKDLRDDAIAESTWVDTQNLST
ncbi:hypothetical protein Tco_0286096 [Tanacetum coccineum]